MEEVAVETVETLDTPLETEEPPLETEEPVVETPAPADAEDAAEAAPKKKAGRPAGAKSKAQGKARPKRVAANRMRARALEEAAPPPPPEEEAQLPRALAGSRPIPMESEIDPRDRTSVMMMTLLRQQAAERRQRKADLWKSWFR
ncbi:MAG: hypothetical protein ACFHHU_01425 [Porticoccaceae bacterium]|jgi:hypothetical protein